MSRRVKLYLCREVLVESIKHIDENEFFLTEDRLLDESGKIIFKLMLNDDGTEFSREYWKYDEQGRDLECKEVTVGTEQPTITRWEYNAEGKVTFQKKMYDGNDVLLKSWIYDGFGRLVKYVVNDFDDEEDSIIYTYQGETSCCIKEENFHGNEIFSPVVTRVWDMSVDPPFLSEENHDFPDDEFKNKYFRFYAVKPGSKGIEMEVYNSNGDFLEESRVHVDVEDRITYRGKFLDDMEDSIADETEVWKYDEKGNVIFYSHSRGSNTGRSLVYEIVSVYDNAGNLLLQLNRNGGDSTIEKYVYEEV